MKYIFFSLLLSFIVSCNTSQKNNDTSSNASDSSSSDVIKPIMKLNASNDTDNVTVKVAEQILSINYFRNRPQYIVVDNNNFGKGFTMNHYAKENKGIYYSLTDSNTLNALGVKYIDGHSGVDMVIDPGKKDVHTLSVWKEYSNDGVKYDFSEITNNKVRVYKYKDGQVVDSFFLIKQ